MKAGFGQKDFAFLPAPDARSTEFIEFGTGSCSWSHNTRVWHWILQLKPKHTSLALDPTAEVITHEFDTGHKTLLPVPLTLLPLQSLSLTDYSLWSSTLLFLLPCICNFLSHLYGSLIWNMRLFFHCNIFALLFKRNCSLECEIPALQTALLYK